MHRETMQNGRVVVIPKDRLFPHPRDAGALPTTTWPVGQLADYVLEFSAGAAPLLVREFRDRFEAFLAAIDLAKRVLQLMEDSPEASRYVGGALLGALAGAAIGRNRNAALLGAGAGLLLVAVASRASASRSQDIGNPARLVTVT